MQHHTAPSTLLLPKEHCTVPASSFKSEEDIMARLNELKKLHQRYSACIQGSNLTQPIFAFPSASSDQTSDEDENHDQDTGASDQLDTENDQQDNNRRTMRNLKQLQLLMPSKRLKLHGNSAAARRLRDPKKKKIKNPPEITQLQAAIAKAIYLQHGNAANLDTIVEFVNKYWNELRRRDGTPYSNTECRKAVSANLRNNNSSRSLFMKGPAEHLWVLTPYASIHATEEILDQILKGTGLSNCSSPSGDQKSDSEHSSKKIT
jgi:hypothetical protein